MSYAQKSSDFELFNKKYSYQYDKISNTFSICAETIDVDKCNKFKLKDEDVFSLLEMKTKTDSYFKEILDSASKYDALEIDIDVVNLNKNNKDTITYIKPTTTKAFSIEKSDTTYTIKPLNKYYESLGEIKLNYTEDIVAKKTDFLVAVADTLKTELNKNDVTIQKSLKDTYEDEFKDFYKNKIEKVNDYIYLTTESLTPNGGEATERYVIHYLLKETYFILKVFKVDDLKTNKNYGPYDLTVSENEFVQKTLEQYGQFKADNFNVLTLEKVYAKLKLPVESKIVKIKKEEANKAIATIADSLENIATTYSGVLKLKKEFVLKPNRHNKIVTTNRIFKVDSATVRFFNNRVDNIAIAGRVGKDTIVLVNNIYSLPLREFNHRKQTNTVWDSNNERLKYNYDDVLDYLPYLKYNYAVKNDEIQLFPGESVKVKERKLMDYFTGIFFSDFLGLNNNNSNGLIVAEGNMRFPLHLRNYGVFTFFDNLSIYASANLFSGFENSSRKINLPNVIVENAETFTEDDPLLFKTDNFNLLLNNNIDAGIRLSLITTEWKGASTFIHLRYGLRFLRTGVEYSLFNREVSNDPNIAPVDTLFENKDFQVFSVGQELEANFEIRPQSNIGADLTVGLNWFGATGTSKNDIKFNTINNSPNLKVMANLYALTNPNSSKSGLFFRLGGHYNLGSYKLFPQLMVGYATNLTSFVNKLQSKSGKK